MWSDAYFFMANGFGIIIIFFPRSKTKKKFFVLSFPLFFVTVCVLFIIFFALESGMYYKIKWKIYKWIGYLLVIFLISCFLCSKFPDFFCGYIFLQGIWLYSTWDFISVPLMRKLLQRNFTFMIRWEQEIMHSS